MALKSVSEDTLEKCQAGRSRTTAAKTIPWKTGDGHVKKEEIDIDVKY